MLVRVFTAKYNTIIQTESTNQRAALQQSQQLAVSLTSNGCLWSCNQRRKRL